MIAGSGDSQCERTIDGVKNLNVGLEYRRRQTATNTYEGIRTVTRNKTIFQNLRKMDSLACVELKARRWKRLGPRKRKRRTIVLAGKFKLLWGCSVYEGGRECRNTNLDHTVGE